MAIKWAEQNSITEFVPEVAVIYLMPQAHGAPLEVRVRFVSHAFHSQRPVLCIEIEDGTTQDNIAASWDELKRLRNELNKTRGPYDRPGGGASAFYRWCWEKNADGYTWQQIAASVNQSIKQALTPPDDPFAVPGIPASTLIKWACDGSRGYTDKETGRLYPYEPVPDNLDPSQVLDNYPATAEGLKARVRSWRGRYDTG